MPITTLIVNGTSVPLPPPPPSLPDPFVDVEIKTSPNGDMAIEVKTNAATTVRIDGVVVR